MDLGDFTTCIYECSLSGVHRTSSSINFDFSI